jgi:hypothetical protein
MSSLAKFRQPQTQIDMAEKKAIPKTTKGKGRNYLSVKEGAGMTAAGRRAENARTGGNLKAPAPNPKTEKDKARKKSFCARSASWDKPRGIAARKRWNC